MSAATLQALSLSRITGNGCMLVWIWLVRVIAFDRCPLGVPCLSV